MNAAPYYTLPPVVPSPAVEFIEPLEGVDHETSFSLIAPSETRGQNVRSHYWKMLPEEEKKAEKKRRKELLQKDSSSLMPPAVRKR